MAQVAPAPITPEGEEVPARTINVAAADGEEDAPLPPNFEVDGKEVRFSENSLFCLTPDNALRKAFVKFILWRWFDNGILFCILLNTILMAIQDFRFVHESEKGDHTVGEITTEGFSNKANDALEIPLTIIFVIEFVCKVIAMGFYDPAGGSYLSDEWNWLDFVVVLTSIAPWVPGIPNVSVVKTCRLLRPLKSLNAVPELAILVKKILRTGQGILNVGVVLLFVFTIFGIMGVQLFGTSGAMHRQCRATPFPVLTTWTPGDDFYEFACLPEAETGQDPLYTTVDCRPTECDIPEHVGALKESPWIEKEELAKKYSSQTKSPWYDARPHCYWPLSEREDEGRMCSYEPDGFNCYGDVPQYTQEEEAKETIDWWAYKFGNARGGQGRGRRGYGSVAVVANRDDDEAWSAINRTWCGSNYDAFGNSRFVKGRAPISDPDLWNGDFNWGFTTFDNLAAAWLTIFQSVTMEGWSDVMYNTMDATNSVQAMLYFFMLTWVGAFWSMNLFIAVIEEAFGDDEDDDEEDGDAGAASGEQPSAEEAKPKKKVVHPYTDWITDDEGLLSSIVMVLIVVNTIVLALDRHGMSEQMELELEITSQVLAACFVIEALLKIGAMGLKTYMADHWNKFDFFIVLTSIYEAFPTTSADGSLAVFRMLRLLRIFKLAKKWEDMQNLLKLLYDTTIDVSWFLVLVLLFMTIFALLGMQMFANRMRFDPETERRLNIMPIEDVPEGSFYWNSSEIRLGESRPRHHFDTFAFAFLTVFGILSGENWNGVMYDGWRAMGPGSGGGDKWAWLSTGYFILLIIMGAFIVLNLCVVLLLDNLQEGMEGDEESDEEGDEEEEEEAWNVITANQEQDEEPKVKPLNTMVEVKQEDGCLAMTVAFVVGWLTPGGLYKKLQFLCRNLHPDVLAENAKLKNLAFQNREKGDDRDSLFPLTAGKSLGLFSEKSSIRIASALLAEHPAFDSTVLVLIMISTVLLTLQSPLQNPHSDLVKFMDVMDLILTVLFTFEMLVKIVASGFVCMKASYLRNPWNQLDFIVVIISLINVSLTEKQVADSGVPMSALKVIRTLRAFRPLRMIQRAPGLKVIVNALFSSLPGVLNVLILLLLILLMFAIFSVQNYKGLMRSCQGDHYDFISENEMLHDILLHPKKWNALNMTQKAFFGPDSEYFNTEETWSNIYGVEGRHFKQPATERPAYTNWQGLDANASWYDNPEPLCGIWKNYDSWSQKKPLLNGDETKNWWNEKPTSKVICRCLGAQWDKDVPQSFDNVFDAMTALFELSTTEGWLDVLYVIMDSCGVDMQPIRREDIDVNWGHPLYFFFVIVLWNFLFLNLFVGITIDNFDKIKARSETGSLFLTDSQKEWVRTQEMLLKINPQAKLNRPGDPFSGLMFDLVNHRWFDPFIMGCIVLNTASLASGHLGQSEDFEGAMEGLNMALAVIFTFEMVAKLAALRMDYFADNWNVFDFLVVIITWVSMFGGGGGAGSVLRSFRVLRVVRLMNRSPQLKQIFNTLFMTLPALANLAAVLLLFFIIFSVMAVQLFATVQLNGDFGIDERINFQTFFRSFITLLRFSTGENWNGFMHEVAFDYPGCRKPGPGDDQMNWDTSPNVCGYHDVQGCTPIDGCGEPLIYPYMIVFNLMVAFVFLNLFIGVILEGFENAEEAAHAMNEDDFEWFNEVWNRPEFDPPSGPRTGDDVCYIDVDMLSPFAKALVCDTEHEEHRHSFSALKDEWGLDGGKGSKRKLEKFLHKFDLKIFANEEGSHKVHFKHVLMVFGKELLRIKLDKDGKETQFDIPPAKEDKVASLLRDNVGQYMRGIDTHALLQSNDSTYTLRHHSAAMVLSKRLKENQLKRIRSRAAAARERVSAPESPKKGAAAFAPTTPSASAGGEPELRPTTPNGQAPTLAPLDGVTMAPKLSDGDALLGLQATPKTIKNQSQNFQEAKEDFGSGADHEDSLL